jgi:uncharacterized protein (PEP-CTERM system associated)
MASNRNNSGRRGISFAGISFASLSLALLTPASASAVDFDFKPTLSLMERFSDNVSLSATNPQSSFLSEIRPGFSLSSKGTRTRLSVDYGLQALLYSHDRDANTHNNQLTARLGSDWLDRRLVINADARIGQQNINSTGAVGTGNFNVTGNSAETRTFSIAPAWKSRFGNQANLDARWQLTYSDSDSAALSSTTANSLALSLSSGSAFNQIPWALAYRVAGSDANANGDRNASLSGTLGYIYSPKTRFNLTLGKDSNNGTTTGFDQADGIYWNVGVNWAPTLRTSLNATAGKRYNGDSYGLNLTHRTRKSSWALRYSEEITDAYALLTATSAVDIYNCGGNTPPFIVTAGAVPDSAACGGLTPTPIILAAVLSYPQLVDGFNLNRSWSGITTYKTGKSVFSLSLNKSRRELLATNGSDSTYGLVGSWTLRVGPRTSSSLLFNATHSENAVAEESDDLSLSWLLSYQLSRQATGVVELRRVERTSGSTTGAYDENSISARLNMSF